MRLLAGRLGILQADPEAYLRGDTARGEASDDALIDDLVAQRQAARERRNWAEADRLRDQLTEMGVELEDSAEGTRWRRA
jgi:cysteinyl-tRNA synthetase